MSEMDNKPLLVTLSGGWWHVPKVKDEPVVELRQWQVFKLSDGEVHFVGWQESSLQGRVTSAVVEFDAARRCGRTKSGRVHKLVGPPGCNGDASYTWATWLRLNREESCEDVSEQFEAMMNEPSA